MAKIIRLTEKENLLCLEAKNITLDFRRDSNNLLTLHVNKISSINYFYL